MAAAAGHDRAGGSLRSRCSRRLAGRWARRRSCRFPRRPCPGFRAPARLSGVGPLRSLLAGRLRVRARCPRPACVRAAARGRRGKRPPRRSRACCGVLFRRFSALAALGRRLGSRVLFARPAPSPSVSPPFRRPLAWFAPCCGVGRGGAASAPAGRLSVVGLGGLAAGRALFCVPSAGCRPASRPVSRPRRASGRCRWRLFRRLVGGGAGRCARFRVGSFPFPRRARGALPPSPLRASPFGGRTRPEILAGAGEQPPASFGRWPKSVARGARALPSPLSLRSSSRRWRARSACRAVCSFRALRRASPPSSGWPGAVVKDVSSSSVRAWGTGTRRWRSDRRRWRRFSPNRAEKPRGEVSPASVHKILCTKNPRPEKYWQGTAGNGSRKCHQKAPALTRGGQRGIPNPKRPADWPEMGYQMSSRCLSVR